MSFRLKRSGMEKALEMTLINNRFENRKNFFKL